MTVARELNSVNAISGAWKIMPSRFYQFKNKSPVLNCSTRHSPEATFALHNNVSVERVNNRLKDDRVGFVIVGLFRIGLRSLHSGARYSSTCFPDSWSSDRFNTETSKLLSDRNCLRFLFNINSEIRFRNYFIPLSLENARSYTGTLEMVFTRKSSTLA